MDFSSLFSILEEAEEMTTAWDDESMDQGFSIFQTNRVWQYCEGIKTKNKQKKNYTNGLW